MIGSMLAAGLGAGIQTAGSLWANEQNLKYSRWKNNIDWAIAQQNNATQIEMANSAHQREVQDLRAAGLNPILSAGGNGASSPTLTSPEMSTPQVENPVSSFGSSARQVAQMISDSTEADIGMKLATTSNLEAQNSNIHVQNRLIQAQATELEHETARKDFAATYGAVGTQLHQGAVFIRDLFRDAAHDVDRWSAGGLDRLERAIDDLRKRWDNWQPNININQVMPGNVRSDSPFTLDSKNY